MNERLPPPLTRDEEFSMDAYDEARRRSGSGSDGEFAVSRSRDIPWFPRVSPDFEAQVRYWEMRFDGQSHSMAEMLATRTFPGTKGTDRSFMQGRHLDGSQFEGLPPIVGRDYVKKAEAAGVNPAGKYYSGGLARFPGDPQAWVNSLNDVRRVAERRGLEVHGAVDVEPPKDSGWRPGPYKVADSLVEAEVGRRIAADPGLATKREEVKEEAAHRMAGRWA